MKASVKNTNYEIGQKVYFSEGVEEKYFRGVIVENLRTSVVVLNKENKKQGILKRNLGIVI